MSFIDREQWKTFLEDFSKRNQWRATRLEVVDNEAGVHEEEEGLPLIGVTLESEGRDSGSVVIALGGETANDLRHIEHSVEGVERIAPIAGESGMEDGLGFEDREGNKTLLTFTHLPEIPENTGGQAWTRR